MNSKCPVTQAEHRWLLTGSPYRGSYRVYRCAHCKQKVTEPRILSKRGDR